MTLIWAAYFCIIKAVGKITGKNRFDQITTIIIIVVISYLLQGNKLPQTLQLNAMYICRLVSWLRSPGIKHSPSLTLTRLPSRCHIAVSYCCVLELMQLLAKFNSIWLQDVNPHFLADCQPGNNLSSQMPPAIPSHTTLLKALLQHGARGLNMVTYFFNAMGNFTSIC